MFILPLFVFAGDLHHSVLGLHRELLRSKVIDVQGHPPAVGCLSDLGDAAAELPVECSTEGGRGHSHGRWALGGRSRQWAQVAGPAGGAEPLRPLVGHPRYPEGLLEEAAVSRVPVPERFPARAAQERERHAALGHVAGLGWVGMGI
uniref:Uncharacterized protein n=1 Tax=Nannospalax galili TaxID=1026970 RepID=A0A8C6RSU0_NANGA